LKFFKKPEAEPFQAFYRVLKKKKFVILLLFEVVAFIRVEIVFYFIKIIWLGGF